MTTIKEAYDNMKAMEKIVQQTGIPVEHLNMYSITDNNGQISIEKNNKSTGWVSRKEDTRYNVPKSEPSVEHDVIDTTIAETEIYRRARLAILGDVQRNQTINHNKATDIILKAQQRQVGYGLEKYPEPLNPNTWSISETIGHIIDESIDKMHYLVMLRIKFEQGLVGKADTRTYSVIETIDRMIEDAIEELYSLVELSIEDDIKTQLEQVREHGTAYTTTQTDKMTKCVSVDSMDAWSYIPATEYNNGTLTLSSQAVGPNAKIEVDIDEILAKSNEQAKLLVDLKAKKAGLI